MANAKAYTAQGVENGSVELPAALFDQQVNEHLLAAREERIRSERKIVQKSF